MKFRPIHRLGIDLRKKHRFLHSWRKAAAECGVVTKGGRADPAMASRIAQKGYEPHQIDTRARLGLKPYCFVCKQTIRKPRVKRAAGYKKPIRPGAMSDTKALDEMLKASLLANIMNPDACAKINQAGAELDQLRTENADLTRKGLLLCNQNGELLMERIQLRTDLEEAIRVIEELTRPLDYATQFAHAAAFLERMKGGDA